MMAAGQEINPNDIKNLNQLNAFYTTRLQSEVATSPTPTVTIQQSFEDWSKRKNDLDMLTGFKFGVGVLGAHFHGKKRVEEASVQNGKVQIDDGDNTTAGVVLETHQLFGHLWGPMYIGPFLGLKTNNEEIIDAAMLGVMFAAKSRDDEKSSFNIGIGYIIDPKVSVLADGFEEGQSLPAGETNVRTKKVTQHGWGVVVSYGF